VTHNLIKCIKIGSIMRVRECIVGVAQEGSLSVTSVSHVPRVPVGLRMNLLGRCALACPFQIRCQHWWP
jgi:hypothetical protein